MKQIEGDPDITVKIEDREVRPFRFFDDDLDSFITPLKKSATREDRVDLESLTSGDFWRVWHELDPDIADLYEGIRIDFASEADLYHSLAENSDTPLDALRAYKSAWFILDYLDRTKHIRADMYFREDAILKRTVSAIARAISGAKTAAATLARRALSVKNLFSRDDVETPSGGPQFIWRHNYVGPNPREEHMARDGNIYSWDDLPGDGEAPGEYAGCQCSAESPGNEPLERGDAGEWNEADHPRDEDGKFAESGAGSGGKELHLTPGNTKEIARGLVEVQVDGEVFLVKKDEDEAVAALSAKNFERAWEKSPLSQQFKLNPEKNYIDLEDQFIDQAADALRGSTTYDRWAAKAEKAQRKEFDFDRHQAIAEYESDDDPNKGTLEDFLVEGWGSGDDLGETGYSTDQRGEFVFTPKEADWEDYAQNYALDRLLPKAEKIMEKVRDKAVDVVSQALLPEDLRLELGDYKKITVKGLPGFDDVEHSDAFDPDQPRAEDGKWTEKAHRETFKRLIEPNDREDASDQPDFIQLWSVIDPIHCAMFDDFVRDMPYPQTEEELFERLAEAAPRALYRQPEWEEFRRKFPTAGFDDYVLTEVYPDAWHVWVHLEDLRATQDAFNPDQPRDERGRFASTGSGGSKASKASVARSVASAKKSIEEARARRQERLEAAKAKVKKLAEQRKAKKEAAKDPLASGLAKQHQAL